MLREWSELTRYAAGCGALLSLLDSGIDNDSGLIESSPVPRTVCLAFKVRSRELVYTVRAAGISHHASSARWKCALTCSDCIFGGAVPLDTQGGIRRDLVT